MSILEEVIKALEAVVAPELKALNERLEAFQRENKLELTAIRQEIKTLEEKMVLRFDGLNHRFDDVLDRLALDRRLAAVEKELDESRKAS